MEAHRLVVAMLLLVAALPAASAQDDPSEFECLFSEARIECSLVVALNLQRQFGRDVPTFPSSIVTVSVALEGRDGGWAYNLTDATGTESSQTYHYAKADEAGTFVAQTDTHLLGRAPDAPPYSHRLIFINCAFEYSYGPFRDCPRSSSGTFRISYVAEALPPGAIPSRPAATRDTPHLPDDGISDAATPSLDLLAAWFDDRSVGDGLMDAHVAVGSLSSFDFNRTDGQVATPNVAGKVQSWYFGFTVFETDYLLRWFVAWTPDARLEYGCELRRGEFQSSSLVMTPRCVFDELTSTLHAEFPERSIGSPGESVYFTNMFAESYTLDSGNPSRQDTMDRMQFAFALGGPAVWSRLNPALDPPVPLTPVWYRAPLASENIPDTLQVVGAILAALTFLGGLVLVMRNRVQTRALLDRVDALVDAQNNARSALLALGELESEFTRLYRRGRLNESQYSVATQRIASAAARVALRHELGLDDGVPGPGTPADTRTLHVQGPAERVDTRR